MNFSTAVHARLSERGLRLPARMPKPAGLYVPWRLHNGIGFLAAQVPGYGAGTFPGRVGHELTLEQGRAAAVMAALNALGRINQALDGFDRLEGLLHIAGHVASSDAFWEQPEVLDGASELLNFVLAERAPHTRTAFPVPRLPKNISVELEITFAYSI